MKEESKYCPECETPEGEMSFRMLVCETHVESWSERIDRYIREGRTVSGGKGGNSQSEMDAANQQRQMETQLMQQQLNLQTQQLNSVNSTVNPMIANGGLSPQMLSALQANLVNKLGTNDQQMMGNLNQQLQARGLTGGLTGAGGGGVGQGFGALYSALAGQQQQGTFDIANLQQQSLMNELGLKLGIGSQFGGNVGTFTGGMSNALNSGVTAANNADQAQTSWMGPVFGALGSLGGSAMTAFCPARGSLYLMADGSEKPVELLRVGDKLHGIDGEPQTIEEIQSAITPVLKIETDDGYVGRASRVHAFALPAGGFVVAMYALGKTIRTDNGTSKVTSVKWDGEDEVFNVITDGSHTYLADGIWALGVGEAERHVSMERWQEIGDQLTV